MSKDIRSFFSVVPKGYSKSNFSTKESVILVDSDDDEIVKSTSKYNSKQGFKTILSKSKRYVISSDSEDEKTAKNFPDINSRQEENKLMPISVDEYFGDELVKMKWKDTSPKKDSNKGLQFQQSNNANITSESCNNAVRSFNSTLQGLEDYSISNKKKKIISELGIHDDNNFEKTLELDDNDDDIINNLDILNRTIEEATEKPDLKRKKDQKPKYKQKTSSCVSENSSYETSLNQTAIQKKRTRTNSGVHEFTPKKPKLEHNDSGIDPDQERHEKRRFSAILYKKFLNRGGPRHHGQKELPKGKPDCFKNLTFLRTGVLDSMEGEEFENLVKEHGGRVVHAVSRKVNYVVVGDDPGPVKLDRARGYNIPEIDEDQLLDLILTKSGEEPKFSKIKCVELCDSGISNSASFENSPKKQGTTKKGEALLKAKPFLTELESPSDKTQKKSNSDLRTKDEKKKDKNKALDSKTKMDPDEVEHLLKIKEFLPKEINETSRKVQELDERKAEQVFSQNQASQVLSWADKYKPKDIKGILGQQDASSNMNKLKKWLKNWYKNQQDEVRKKIPKPSPWAKSDDGAYYKAALLSGPPGVGKTTTATLVSKELCFDVVEFNASDTRSKKLLREEVAQLLNTTTIAGFATGYKTITKKRVLLMDEVDGMAGNEDRGGIQELINLIKTTSIPIICMCNDRNHQKMRSLVNYCFDLRFNKPRPQQILSGMMSICYKEGLKISSDVLIEVINGTCCDIRQTLNHLSMWTAIEKNLTLEMASKASTNSKKDTIMGPWEVIRAVFNSENYDTLADKFKLFYYDYSMGPLFVQENYLNVTPKCSVKEKLKYVAAAADAISMATVIDSKIRGSNNWSLLESQALFSSVLPGHYMHGNFTQRINFPGWLGKNSSASKRKRMLGEIFSHTRISTSGSKLAINLDYLVPIRNAIINPLKNLGIDGVQEALEVMRAYLLLRDDLTNLIELCHWKGKRNPFIEIDTKVKSAFTRAYNKGGPLLPFALASGVSKKSATNVDSDVLEEAEYYVDTDTDVEDGIEADSMIKVKNKSKSKGDNTKPSTSRRKESSSKAKDKSKGANVRSKKK